MHSVFGQSFAWHRVCFVAGCATSGCYAADGGSLRRMACLFGMFCNSSCPPFRPMSTCTGIQSVHTDA